MEIIEHVSEKDREIFFLEFVAAAIAMKLERTGMTKKDYIAIAEAINKASLDDEDGWALYALVKNLSILFAKDNPRFDKEKFINACFKE